MKILIKGDPSRPYLSVNLSDIITLPSLKELQYWKLYHLEGTAISGYNILEKEEEINGNEEGVRYSLEQMLALAENITQVVNLQAIGFFKDKSILNNHQYIKVDLEDGCEWEVTVSDENIASELMQLDGAANDIDDSV